MREDRCDDAQVLVNKGLRLIMGSREKNTSISVGALWRELGIPPVSAMAAGRKARAFKKYGSLRTWVRVMFQYPIDSTSVWRGSTQSWLKKYYEGPVSKGISADCMGSGSDEGMTYSKRVMRVVWARKEGKRMCTSLKQYLEYGFGDTVWSSMRAIPMVAVADQVRLGRGLRMLSLCRMGAFPTAARMAKSWKGCKTPPPLPEEFQTKCPCCGQRVEGGETVEHIILACSRWQEQRGSYIEPLMSRIVPQRPPLTGEGICILLLGAEYGGQRLSGWLPSSKKKTPSDTQDANLGQEEIASCGAFQLARFLQAIERSRSLILKQLRRRVAENGSSLQIQGPEFINSHG